MTSMYTGAVSDKTGTVYDVTITFLLYEPKEMHINNLLKMKQQRNGHRNTSQFVNLALSTLL